LLRGAWLGQNPLVAEIPPYPPLLILNHPPTPSLKKKGLNTSFSPLFQRGGVRG